MAFQETVSILSGQSEIEVKERIKALLFVKQRTCSQGIHRKRIKSESWMESA